MGNNFLIYGANGYTGELILRYAVERGLKPIIAGRNADAIRTLASKYGVSHRIFSLDDRAATDAVLDGVAVVLHCAGPFSLTSAPMVEACLRRKVHYTDITGEISVFEAIAARSSEADAAGIALMPGVGFDVVPTDCLALHLQKRLPSATHLRLAFYGLGRMSHGTQATMTMNVGKGGAIRRNGMIVGVPAAWQSRTIDFGAGVSRLATTIPWGDVSTAFHTTGIPNIEVYSVIPPSALRMLKLSRYIGWLFATAPVQRFLQARIPKGGPSDAERKRGKMLIYGEVRDGDGRRAESRLECPEGYTTTALAALRIIEKILAGNVTPGFQTPAKQYGADLILEIDAVRRHDTPLSTFP